MLKIVNQIFIGWGFVVKIGRDGTGMRTGGGWVAVVRFVGVIDLNMFPPLSWHTLPRFRPEQIPAKESERPQYSQADSAINDTLDLLLALLFRVLFCLDVFV